VTTIVLLIGLHACAGVFLAVLIFATGLGVATLVFRDPNDDRARGALAYPAGLLVIVTSAALPLIHPLLAAGSAVAVGLALGALVTRRALLRPLLLPLRADARWLATLAALPVALGLLLHGPTATVPSHSYGDMLFWSGETASARESLVPLRDLQVQGFNRTHLESAPSVVGAALGAIPAIDPILFETTSLPLCLLLSLWIGTRWLRTEAPPGPKRSLAAALLTLGAISYPSAIVETPPLALAFPLGFAVFHVLHQRPTLRQMLGVGGLTAIAAIATKILLLLPLGVVVGAILWRGRGARRAAVIALAVAAAAVIVLLVGSAGWYAQLLEAKALPLDAVRGLHDQLGTRNTKSLAPAIQIAGELLALLALTRARELTLSAALAAALAAQWFVGGYVFDAAVGLPLFVAAVGLWTGDLALRQQRRLLLAAGTGLAVAAWFRDIAGVAQSLPLVLATAAALIAMFMSGPARILALVATASAYAVALGGLEYVAAALALLGIAAAVQPRRRIAAAIVVGIAILSAAIAGRAAASEGLRVTRQPSTYTSDDYDIWRHVAALPSHVLVFTSMTGKPIDGRHGWNSYPAIAGRQLYLAGWYGGPLMTDPDGLDDRLRNNRAVLSGDVTPSIIARSRRYEGYYAVLWAFERVPRSFHRKYANRTFVLYELRS
jgi:hypothetical protein